MASARLLAINPVDRKTRELKLANAEITVGSERGNAFLLRDQSVSRRHAVIRLHGPSYQIRDLKSTNGTFVNERRVDGVALLKDGDHVRFGAVIFVFLNALALGNPKKRRFSIVAMIELTLIVFATGFGLTEYWLNRRLAGQGNGETAFHNSATLIATPNIRPAATVGAPPQVNAIPAESSRMVTTSPARVAGRSDWLDRMNYFRAMAGLPSVKEDSEISVSDGKHARYVMLNYGSTIHNGGAIPGGEDLEEAPNKSGYSEDGAAVALNSEDSYGCGQFSGASQIDNFMASAFHRLAILSPDLDHAGLGSYADTDCWVATIRLPVPLSNPKVFDQPIKFPPDGATVPLKAIPGEWPDPLSSCPGYGERAGLPITLQLGRRIHGQLSAHSLRENGGLIAQCAFDNAMYVNPDHYAQEYARKVLRDLGAIVLIPGEPLKTNTSYAVSITARGQAYTWSFKTAPQEER